MHPISDLVRDSKLETKFCLGYTQHVYYVCGDTPRQRKMRMEERWERGRNLGTGSFGTVWLEKLIAENSEEKYRAVKEIRKGVQRSKAIDYSRELEAIAKFSHQKYEMCFVKSFGWFENHESVFIAMEYFPLGDLQNYLSLPLPENEVKQITSQVLEGLSFMHDNGFAHRDLKPTNILVKSESPDWWLKIGDFGISKRVQEGLTALRSFKGTFGFLAPEILVQQKILDLDDYDFEVSDEYTVAVDMWSLGEIAFRALTTEQPFPIRSLRAYIKGTSPFPAKILHARGVTKEGCDFLNSLMTPMPKDRLTARDALSHIWIEPQISLSTSVSAEIQRSNPTTEETLPSLRYLTIEPSASWSTVNDTMLTANALANPSSTETFPITFQPMQNIPSKAHQKAQNQRKNQGNWLDGELAASASSDQTVRLWDSAAGAAQRTLKGHSDAVWGVAFSLDGRLVASASFDNTVRLWDSATGAAQRTLTGHSDAVYSVAFSPDGRLVASASFDNTVRLWDSATGAAQRTLKGHSDAVYSVAFSPDGRLVASASLDQTVRLWDSATGAAQRTLKGHSDGVWGVAFSPDGRLVASASGDQTVRLWDSAAGAAQCTLKGHSQTVCGVAFSPDGRLVASASVDQTVRLWDSATGTA